MSKSPWMGRLLLLGVVGVALMAGTAGWALLRDGDARPASTVENSEPARPIRLDATITTRALLGVRFSGVLEQETLTWQLKNSADVTKASLILGGIKKPVPLCTTCRRNELGTISLAPSAATAASKGRADLVVQSDTGRRARSSIRAAPCSCAAGLYFAPESSGP
jgi:hypothetical protein